MHVLGKKGQNKVIVIALVAIRATRTIAIIPKHPLIQQVSNQPSHHEGSNALNKKIQILHISLCL